MSDGPAKPRPAATLILLRRGGRHRDRALELLMVRRAASQTFMPGVWVFPGGTIEPGEAPAACAARELREETGIDLGAAPELRPWARWITPEAVPIRFDTHFLIGLAPAHAPPRPDRREVDDAAWISPKAALDANAADELELAFPTVKTLESLLPYDRAEAVLEAARGRIVEPILPRLVGEGEELRILLPGEPGYER